MEPEQKKLQQSLKYSILDGSFYSVMVGFGESFFSAFAIFLQANNILIGLLGSLPQTVGYFSQIYAERLLKIFGSRKRLVCFFALAQALMYIPVALVFFLGDFRIYHLLFFVCIYWLFGMLPVPVWNSWMGDLVPERSRGGYFGRRNQIIGLINFACFVLAGYLLQKISNLWLWPYYGFVLIFGIAFIARLISFFWLNLKYEPFYKISVPGQADFWSYFKELKVKNFSWFVGYQCLMNFALYMAAPFFAPFMLRELQFNYQTFTIITAAAVFSKYLAMPIWGRLCDKYGTKKILAVSGFLMPLNPLLWVISPNIWWLILVNIYGGWVWAGFELAGFIFIYDLMTPARRAAAVACNNSLTGLAILAGSVLGGIVIRYNHLFASKYFLVFLLSFFLRYAASVIFIPRLEEVREVEQVSYKKLIWEVFNAASVRGLVYDLVSYSKNKFRKQKN